MFDAIVAVFVVVAVFCAVASLLMLYVWVTDPYRYGRAFTNSGLHAFWDAARYSFGRTLAPTVSPDVEDDPVTQQTKVLQWYIDHGAPAGKPELAAD
jgi:hypothetical protein